MWNRRRFIAASIASSAIGPFATASVPALSSSTPTSMSGSTILPFPSPPALTPPPEDASPETLLELMQANRVARTVLIQVSHYRWDNSYLASVLKQYPGKFHGVCRVNPEDPAAPDHLTQLTQQGFHGVRLSPAAGAEGDWIRGPLMPPLWRTMCRTQSPDDHPHTRHPPARPRASHRTKPRPHRRHRSHGRLPA